MSSGPQDRLRHHVDLILAQAGVPRTERDDLAEELFGHLVEKWQELVAGGMSVDEAADRALSEFGGPSIIANQLRRTYHSRLWASTIGVLLPLALPADSRPSTVGWLRFVLALIALLTSLLVIALPTLPPIRLLGTGIAAFLGVSGALVAFIALGRRQRWALTYAMAACWLLLIEGMVTAVGSSGGSNLTIPLGAILAAFVLVSAQRHWRELQDFVAPSAQLGGPLGVLLAIALLAPPIVPPALAAFPDPTQATPGDLDLRLSMTCDHGDVDPTNGPTLMDIQRATLVIDSTWSRSDLLPRGLTGWLTGSDDADTLGVRVLRPTEWSWDWSDGPRIVDEVTGHTVGWWGSTSPSVMLLPPEIPGSFTTALGNDEIGTGHTIRTTWLLVPVSDGRAAWPIVEVTYAHLDRFALAGTVECNGISHGMPVDEPAAAPTPGDQLFP